MEVTELNKTIKQFSTGYPKLEKDSQESCQIVRTFVSNIDQLNEVISLEKIFAKKTWQIKKKYFCHFHTGLHH